MPLVANTDYMFNYCQINTIGDIIAPVATTAYEMFWTEHIVTVGDIYMPQVSTSWFFDNSYNLTTCGKLTFKDYSSSNLYGTNNWRDGRIGGQFRLLGDDETYKAVSDQYNE